MITLLKWTDLLGGTWWHVPHGQFFFFFLKVCIICTAIRDFLQQQQTLKLVAFLQQQQTLEPKNQMHFLAAQARCLNLPRWTLAAESATRLHYLLDLTRNSGMILRSQKFRVSWFKTSMLFISYFYWFTYYYLLTLESINDANLGEREGDLRERVLPKVMKLLKVMGLKEKELSLEILEVSLMYIMELWLIIRLEEFRGKYS